MIEAPRAVLVSGVGGHRGLLRNLEGRPGPVAPGIRFSGDRRGAVKSLNPQFQPTPEQLGDSLMAHQRYQAAIEAYKKAPEKSSESWNKMGVAYQLMFNHDEARRCYQKALKLDPKMPS